MQMMMNVWKRVYITTSTLCDGKQDFWFINEVI